MEKIKKEMMTTSKCDSKTLAYVACILCWEHLITTVVYKSLSCVMLHIYIVMFRLMTQLINFNAFDKKKYFF